jgi:glutaminyl-tRNA synthetase
VLNPRSLEVVQGALAEPSVGRAAAGDRFQFERVGYFAIDPDSRSGAVVVNRVVGLRDSWGVKPDVVASAEAARGAAVVRSGKAKTRPRLMSPVEARKIARERDPVLARHHQRFLAIPGVRPEHADLLSGEATVAAIAADAIGHGPGAPILTFLANVEDLEDRLGADADAIARAIAGLVAAIEDGRITRVVANQLLDDVLGHGREPMALVAERGLGKVDDDAVAAAVDRALAGSSDEVARYRAGERKLFGFLVGQAMKQAGGKADPAAVQTLLRARLG